MFSSKIATVFHNSKRLNILPIKRFFKTSSASQLEKMPVLDKIIKKYIPEQPLKGCAILSVQHSLGTMLPVINGLKALGAEELFLMGKNYSECEDAVEEMKKIESVRYYQQEKQNALGRFISTFQFSTSLLWQDLRLYLAQNKKIKRVLVLDHGGYAMNMMPDIDIPIITIEKTTAGINKSGYLLFPRIEMATSAVKRKLESPGIAQAITQKLISQSLLPEIHNPGQYCAVIGYGAVGSALTEHLVSLGHQVFVYDVNPSKIGTLPKDVTIADDLNMAVAYSKIIFGCTGKDITEGKIALFNHSPNDKILVSASSDDIEFLSLLRHHQLKENRRTTNPMQTIEIKNDKGKMIKILRGGFPANFDNTFESVPPEYIQLTRSLVIAAIIQAAQLNNPLLVYSYMLHPKEQIEIAHDFISFLQEYSPAYPHLQECAEIFSQHNVIDWITKNSGGKIPIIEQSTETVPI